jgi:phosphate transport system permease protein
MSEYASVRVRDITKPMLEILAGIPTVVYGFFAAITVAPAIVALFESIGFEVSFQNALAPGIIMGIMIIPIISSLCDDVISAVPRHVRHGSLALGMTKAETIKNIVLPSALPGIISASLLGVSRALGETMIVVMAAGLSANLTMNPLETMTTVTVRIVDAMTGDQEFSSPETLSAFALGLVLFAITLVINIIAVTIIKKFHEKYKVSSL